MTINSRAATGTEVLGVDFADRIISLVVVPYEESALVPHAGQVWEESFSRSAFDHLDPHRVVRVNRDHDRSKTVGKVVRFDTRDPRGLIADIKIARTLLGDETLQLAAEDCLSASIGFGVDPQRGVIADRVTRTRRIIHAILDHISLVEQPAYAGAKVLSVRSITPNLDHYLSDPVIAWAEQRCDPIWQWARRRVGR
jgi:phage head maturation protease